VRFGAASDFPAELSESPFPTAVVNVWDGGLCGTTNNPELHSADVTDARNRWALDAGPVLRNPSFVDAYRRCISF
jgi:hypothetical protein